MAIYDKLSKSSMKPKMFTGDAVSEEEDIVESGEEIPEMPLSKNSLILTEEAAQGAEDGQKVKWMVEGTIVERDGKKVLMVDSVDGFPLESVEEEEVEEIQEEPLSLGEAFEKTKGKVIEE